MVGDWEGKKILTLLVIFTGIIFPNAGKSTTCQNRKGHFLINALWEIILIKKLSVHDALLFLFFPNEFLSVQCKSALSAFYKIVLGYSFCMNFNSWKRGYWGWYQEMCDNCLRNRAVSQYHNCRCWMNIWCEVNFPQIVFFPMQEVMQKLNL